LNTIGKIYKANGCELTGYYGKQHLDSKLATGVNTIPTFNTATTDAMKIYGYDNFNVFGDTYYSPSKGLFSDNQIISYELPPNSQIYDYIESGIKYSGVIPFIKARLIDNKSYYLECHITNPHDTNHFIQNLKQKPSGIMNQFSIPFIEEQLDEDQVQNPYYFNINNPYAVPTHPNLLANYYEPKYIPYKTNKFSLPFLTSYELDYAIDPKINSLNPLMIGTYYALKFNMTISESQKDIKDWKNFLNNYIGLVYEADSYLEKLYYFFESNGIFLNSNIIIISDHGDLLSSHGLKQKQLPFNECSNVPCLIYSPDLDPNLIGKTSDLYGSLVDILPTQLILNNLQSDTNLDGKSLLVRNNLNQLILNEYEHKLYVPINIVNSTMYSLNYFFYLKWYIQNYSGNVLTSHPRNLFEFQSSFVSIITEIDGIIYKFGRYYSIYSVIIYQLFYYPEQNLFTKYEFIQYIMDKLTISKINTSAYIEENFSNVFTYQEGLNIINNDFKNYNIYIYYIYNAYIANKLNTINNFIYLLPGSKSSWEVNDNLNIFSYFMYDIKKDPSESFNLMDIVNIEYINNEIKNKLNDTLNLALEEKNCFQLQTILADNIFTKLANLLYIFGGFLSNMTNDIQFNILGTLNGSSGLDIQIIQDKKNIFTEYINERINYINSFNLTNPYSLYDGITNKYYVSNYDYIEYIYTNIQYFKNFIISKGLPNLTNKKFIIESNNILPLLNVYKVIKN
jgi:arylsulfatase A-like enzyme